MISAVITYLRCFLLAMALTIPVTLLVQWLAGIPVAVIVGGLVGAGSACVFYVREAL